MQHHIQENNLVKINLGLYLCFDFISTIESQIPSAIGLTRCQLAMSISNFYSMHSISILLLLKKYIFKISSKKKKSFYYIT